MLSKSQSGKPDTAGTIQKTIMTALLFEGFWDRWITHGLNREEVIAFRPHLKTLDGWAQVLNKYALQYEKQATSFQNQNLLAEAEYLYRTAGLYYQLIQWIFPETCDEKQRWFAASKELFHRADAISMDQILESTIQVGGRDCFGRTRVPESPKGCVVIINPIDSSKEELFAYEMDFAKRGFVTVSFDGPGQGETYTFNKFKANRARWVLFVKQVIDFAADCYPGLSVHLFGTSSGAAWALHGSRHPKVKKAVSVSPAFKTGVKLPDYFTERLSAILEDQEISLIPDLEHLEQFSPVLLFHGKEDVMVKDQDIHELYQKLPRGKRLIEYADEGHCCNFKLGEIRQLSAKWFMEGNE